MNQLIMEILKHEGVATIVTKGPDGPHVVATWNTYIGNEGADKLLIPVGGYNKTENNIKSGSKLIMLIGSKEVHGKMGLGTGLRLIGSAAFVYEGTMFEKIKNRFPWARATVVFTIENSEQLL